MGKENWMQNEKVQFSVELKTTIQLVCEPLDLPSLLQKTVLCMPSTPCKVLHEAGVRVAKEWGMSESRRLRYYSGNKCKISQGM